VTTPNEERPTPSGAPQPAMAESVTAAPATPQSATAQPDPQAPPVVALMVVHEPGDWLADTLRSLAVQDYPDLRFVALVTSPTPAEVVEQIRVGVPGALVRTVEGNPGFGPIVNEALALVDGRDGFLLVLHDDVALRDDTVSQLVEEAFRSNAAVIGPKLVEWDAPDVLQHVGLDADRAGLLVGVVDPGERDQEQHDAVRDVFALPSACLLVRNDVFREIGGFAPNIPFLGEELEFCWRVHLLGARVVVNPSAVVRHRGAFAVRATLVNADVRAARHRVRTAMTCAPSSQLPLVFLRLVVGSLVETIVGLFGGRHHAGLAGLRAVAALVVDAPFVVARRRALRPLRRVPGREVTSLQLRSSARVAAFARHRRALREQHTSETPAIGAAPAPVVRATTLVGLALLVAVIVGNRGIIWGGTQSIGEFVPLLPADTSVADAARLYLVGWSPGWFGSTGAAPTYLGAMAVLGALSFGNYAALLTAIVVGAFFVAAAGAWRLAGAVGDARTRMFAAVVYLAVPVGILAVRDGRRGALVVWALLPWIVDFARRLAGLARESRDAVRESSVRSVGARRAQLLASLVLLVAAASTFEPAALVVVAAASLALACAAPFTSTPWRATAWLVAAPLSGVPAAAVLHLPWSVRFVDADWWTAVVGAAAPVTGVSLLDVASTGIANPVWRWLVVAVYAPVLLMVLASLGARGAWAVRGVALVVIPFVVLLARERGLLRAAVPEPLVVWSLVALGVTLSACVAYADYLDGRARSLTWRQLAATVSVAAVCVACVPSAVAAFDGRWSQPDDTIGRLVAQLPDDSAGDYAVLYLGDARLFPVYAVALVAPVEAPGGALDAPTATPDAAADAPAAAADAPAAAADALLATTGGRFPAGVSYGVLHDGGASGVDVLPAAPSTMTAALQRAVDVLVTGESLRAGRLLAPLAVRFVVVPLRDGTLHARRAPVGGGTGEALVARLADQLDLRRLYTATDLVIFENAAALPTQSLLDERGAVASRQAGEAELLAEPLLSRGSFVSGLAPQRANAGPMSAGTVHLAMPFSDRWTLRVDGARIVPRVAFGSTIAFDAPVAGAAVLRLAPSLAQRVLVAMQVVLWLLVLSITFNPSRFRGRVRAAREVVEVSLRSDDRRVAADEIRAGVS